MPLTDENGLVCVVLNGATIRDWPSFHAASAVAFGFPDYYGHNRDAWNDCMSSLEESSRPEIVNASFILIEVVEGETLVHNAPEIARFLIEGCASVNRQRVLTRADGFERGPLAIAVALNI